MSTAYFREHLAFLVSVQKGSTTKRANAVHNSTDDEIKFLGECCANIVNGTIPVGTKVVSKLRAVKTQLRIISNKNTTSSRRRKLLNKLHQSILTLVARKSVHFLTECLSEP